MSIKKDNQRTWVLKQLLKNGYITRNECLGNYISRLSAIIFDLKRFDNLNFRTKLKEEEKKFFKKDYPYILTSSRNMVKKLLSRAY